MKPHHSLLVLASCASLLFASCESSQSNMTVRDSAGNYITTSDFRAMNRVEFFRSMDAGLADFDEQLAELRARANTLGGDTLHEFADCEDHLMEMRTDFVNQLAVAENALDDDWPEERGETVDSYEDLRGALSEAFEDVLDS